jgi:putative addiction module component (TIGR02574 family)
MSETATDLLHAALNLPESERAEMADLLVASLSSTSTSLHPAWTDELRRRTAEIDAGQLRPLPLEEVRQQVQAQLNIRT